MNADITITTKPTQTSYFLRKEVNSLSVSRETLRTWYNKISEGMLDTRYVENNPNKGVANINRIDTYPRVGNDFDAIAKRLDRENHPIRPNTRSKRGLGNDTTQGGDDAPIPLNGAIRDLEDMVTSFDVSRLPDYDNMATAFCGHLLFSRPSLYLDCINVPRNPVGYTGSDSIWTSDPKKNYFQFATESLTAGFANDNTGRTLLHPLTAFSDNPYMPLFTGKALTYTTTDIGIKTIEKGTTYYGHTIKYGHYNEDHKAGGSVTLEFLNDRYWSVLKTCFMWMAYIYMVSKSNVVRPALSSQTGGVLDYAGSIYYLVTDVTNHRLVYWEKLTGVFPKSVPFSLFSTEDNQKYEANVSIEFDYGIRSDPCDPNVLMDINMLTTGNMTAARQAFEAGPITSAGYDMAARRRQVQNRLLDRQLMARHDNYRGGNLMARSNVEASRPIIRRSIDNSGNRQFYLEWFRNSTNLNSPYANPTSANETYQIT